MQSNKKSTQFAAKLKHEIIFLKNFANSETASETWEEKTKTFAQIIAISENNFGVIEGVSFGHVITEGYFVFITRFIESITIRMRISFNNRIFEIKRIINNKEQNRMLKIITMEI